MIFDWFKKKTPFQPTKPTLEEKPDTAVWLDSAWIIRALKDKE